LSQSPHNPHSEPVRREIVEEKSFTKAYKAMEGSWPRLDDALTGIQYALCINSAACPKIPGTSLSVIWTKKLPGVPESRIFYTYDDDHVYLHYIEPVTADELADAPESSEES